MQNNRFLFFAIVIAIIMAIAGFLVISFLMSNPEVPGEAPLEPPAGEGVQGIPPGSQPLNVDGTIVYLQPDPNKSVQLVAGQPLPTQPLPTQPLPQPTATPLPQLQPTIPSQPTATAPPAPAAPAGGVNPIIVVPYTVQQGDTLFRITENRATSIELMAVYGIDAQDLTPGTTIQLPVANPDFCPGLRTYVVRPGDTVFRIAQRFNTTKEAIATANNLGPDFRINIAHVLCIP